MAASLLGRAYGTVGSGLPIVVSALAVASGAEESTDCQSAVTSSALSELSTSRREAGARAGVDYARGDAGDAHELRFLADSMLGRLSRWLRVMGVDVEPIDEPEHKKVQQSPWPPVLARNVQ